MTGQISQHELDKLYKRLIADGGKQSKVLCSDPSVSPLVFDSEESEQRFLAQLNCFYDNLPQPQLDGSEKVSEG